MNYENWCKTNTTMPIPINIDTVHKLKREGKVVAARKLLLAYHQELKSIKRQKKLDIDKLDRIKKHFYGICAILGCKRPIKGSSYYCEYHKEQKKAVYYKNKKDGICLLCKQKATHGLLCKKHRLMAREYKNDN